MPDRISVLQGRETWALFFFNQEFIPGTLTERIMTVILAIQCLSTFKMKTLLHAVQDVKVSRVVLLQVQIGILFLSLLPYSFTTSVNIY